MHTYVLKGQTAQIGSNTIRMDLKWSKLLIRSALLTVWTFAYYYFRLFKSFINL